MSDEYTPRAGTAAQKVIEFLQKQPAGASFTGPELEAKLKVKSLSIAMRKPVEHGLVQSEKRGNALVFSLAAPPQPSDGKLTIGSWSDGDVTVAGGVNNEDGSVTYTREQLEQLLQHVTTPHIVHRAPAAPVMG